MSRKVNYGFAIIGLIVALFIMSALAFALPRNDAAATVHQLNTKGEGRCSAVMIAPEIALTARHCMFVDSLTLTIDGIEYIVSEGYGNPGLDLALLVIPGAPCPCAVLTGERVQSGDPVMIIGYPYSIGKVVTYGEVQDRVLLNDIEYLMTTASARPGNSGGGLFNAKGELLGIVVMVDLTGYLSFIVEIDPLVKQLLIIPVQ